MKTCVKKLTALLLVMCLFATMVPVAFAYSTIRSGSKGSDVKTMQTMLNKVMNAGLTVDGICGPKSVAAVKAFQSANGLSVDGVCGPKTWTALENKYNTQSADAKVESKCSVKFYSNGGNYSYKAVFLEKGTSYAIKASYTPKRDGHTFLGWATVQTASAPQYYEGSTLHITGDITLYAVWQKNVLSVVPCSHTKGAYLWPEATHPHKQYYKCGNCGATFTDGTTTTLDQCTTCNPPAPTTEAHTHKYEGAGICRICGQYYEGTFVSEKNTVKVANRCNAQGKPYADAEETRSLSVGKQLSVEGYVINAYNNKWYKTTNGDWVNSKHVTPVSSCVMKMGVGRFNPGTLKAGSSYSISGLITSSHTLESVTVGVYYSNGEATNQIKSVAPNASSYDIKNLDKYIKFGSLPGGNYLFKVAAKCSCGKIKNLLGNKGYYELKIMPFATTFDDPDVKSFEEKVLKTWKSPVKESYQNPLTGGRFFGAIRDGGVRSHAGIDYVVRHGTPVYAMQDGVVIEYIADFYQGTDAVSVRHSDGSVARYCEIATRLRAGDTVKQGQQVGTMKASGSGSMLHLELYLGTETGPLKDNSGNYKYVKAPYKTFNRRADLINPEFLLKLPVDR